MGAYRLFTLAFPFVACLAPLIPLDSRAANEIQATGIFAVARDPSGQKAAAVADALLHARASKSRGLRVIEPARVLSGDPRTREEETLERARAALADGRRAYDALSLDDAIARLGQAVSLYQQTGPLLGDLEELEMSLVYLAAALTLRGSADEGESTFLELLTINASYQLEGFPPAVVKSFESAAHRIEKAPNGSVEIYSTPPYAAVYLDGHFEGVTPVTLNDILAGTHYLRIEKVGYVVHGAPLEISANQRITSQTRLKSMKKGVELRDVSARCNDEVAGEAMGGSLRTLAHMLLADTLIFVTVSQSGSDASFIGGTFDATSGTRLSTERAVISVASPTFVQELNAFANRLVTAAERGSAPGGAEGSSGGGSSGAFGLNPGSGTGGNKGTQGGGGGGGGGSFGTNPSARTSPPPEESTPSEVYLGWTMIGVGSAAIVTGGIFGILTIKAHNDFRNTPQDSPDLRHLQDTGKTDAIVSDLCTGGGALLGIGGVVILLVAHRSGPTAEDLLRNPRASALPTPGGAIFTFGGDL
jgi:hypothetical protein